MEKFVAVPLLSEINHSLDKLLERGDSDTDILSYGVLFLPGISEVKSAHKS